jgi:hypothetical protein
VERSSLLLIKYCGNNASDIQLNGPTLLSGRWTFTGSEAHINGNGKRFLDLTTGGTLWIRAGTKLYLSGVKLRGVGLGQNCFLKIKIHNFVYLMLKIEVARKL